MDPLAVAKAIKAKPQFNSMKGRAPGGKIISPVQILRLRGPGQGAQGPKEKWDLVKVIDAYTGTEYLPTLKSEGY